MSEIPRQTVDTEGAWARVEELFHAALAQPTGYREAWIRQETRYDAWLREEVLSLLEALTHHEELSRARSHLPKAENDPAQRLIGQLCGPYRLVGLVGTGGMAWVYEATRVAGEFQQRVAVKVLPATFGGRMLERFLKEKSILASLNHPGIAHLLDGGTTDGGISYLAMEFVQGEPITAYARSQGLGPLDRVRLLRSACEAVQFAHEQRVVHRDIKPSNLLVGAAGEIKLLDFGIAQLLDEGPAGQTTLWRALTPKYASPEQLRGESAGVASDVYQLGVLMGELMEGLPTADSDLASIAAKATQAEPGERYASVAQLAEDLARYRQALPLLARRGNFGYRCSRFVKRHRRLVAGLAFIAALQGVALWSLIRERSLRKSDNDHLISDTETALGRLNQLVIDRDTRLQSQELNANREYLERAYRQNPNDEGLALVLESAYVSLAQREWFRYLPSMMNLQEGRQAWSRVRDLSSALRKQYEHTGGNDVLKHDQYLLGFRLQGLFAAFQDAEIQIELGQGLQSFKQSAQVLSEYRSKAPAFIGSLANSASLYDMLSDRLGANMRWPPGNVLPVQSIHAHEALDALALAGYASALRSRSSPENGSEKESVLTELHLGHLQYWSGDRAEGEQTLRRSVSALQSKRKTGTEFFDLAAARGFFELGRALRNDGRHTAALDALRQADEILTPLWSQASDSVYLRERLGEVRLESAQALLRLGKLKKARDMASEGLHLLRQNAEMAGAPTFCMDLIAQRLLTAEPSELRDAGAALVYAQRAVTQTKGQMPAYLVTLAMAQYAHGEKAEAARTEMAAARSYQNVWAALQPIFDDAPVPAARERYVEVHLQLDRLCRRYPTLLTSSIASSTASTN